MYQYLLLSLLLLPFLLSLCRAALKGPGWSFLGLVLPREAGRVKDGLPGPTCPSCYSVGETMDSDLQDIRKATFSIYKTDLGQNNSQGTQYPWSPQVHVP